MIEKKIHYCWFGGKPIPENLQNCINSWKEKMPDYDLILWNESNFNLEVCNYVKEAYKSKKWAFVTDYVRLYVVYNYGGIYLDTDVEVIKKFDDLLKFPAFIGFEDSYRKKKEVNTGLGFGSMKGNPIIKEMLEDYHKKSFIKKDGSLDLTPCPKIQTELLLKHGLKLDNTYQNLENIIVLPTDYLCPMNQSNGKILITNNTYSIHRYFDSWNNSADKYRRELRMKYSKYGKLISNVVSITIAYYKYFGFFGMIKEIGKKLRK